MNIEKVGVIGAGTMGNGIAQTSATAGYKVILNDVEEDILEEAINNIDWSLGKFVEKNKITEEEKEEILNRIETTTDLAEVPDSDLVIEAAPEEMDLKKRIFSKIDDSAPKETILSSNTSSLSITEMSEATSRPEKFIGIHFTNPPPIVPLVEIIKGDYTSEETVQAATKYVESLDKVSVICKKDVPGFILNRVYAQVVLEGAWALYRDEAGKEEIDAAVKFGAGFPMGILEGIDIAGLDVQKSVGKVLHDAYGERMKPCPLLTNLAEEGKLGKKSGEGFYDSWPERPDISPDEAGEYDYERVFAVAVNESMRLINENIAEPKDIDKGIKFGLGWNRGPCEIAEEEGFDKIKEKLLNLYKKHGDKRYEPCNLLEEYAESGENLRK